MVRQRLGTPVLHSFCMVLPITSHIETSECPSKCTAHVEEHCWNCYGCIFRTSFNDSSFSIGLEYGQHDLHADTDKASGQRRCPSCFPRKSFLWRCWFYREGVAMIVQAVAKSYGQREEKGGLCFYPNRWMRWITGLDEATSGTFSEREKYRKSHHDALCFRSKRSHNQLPTKTALCI